MNLINLTEIIIGLEKDQNYYYLHCFINFLYLLDLFAHHCLTTCYFLILSLEYSRSFIINNY